MAKVHLLSSRFMEVCQALYTCFYFASSPVCLLACFGNSLQGQRAKLLCHWFLNSTAMKYREPSLENTEPWSDGNSFFNPYVMQVSTGSWNICFVDFPIVLFKEFMFTLNDKKGESECKVFYYVACLRSLLLLGTVFWSLGLLWLATNILVSQ